MSMVSLGQDPLLLLSFHERLGELEHTSVAVANPVLPGSVESVQLMLILSGQSMSGGLGVLNGD